jgi:serine/threonine protein phosphatase 1
MDRCRKVRKAPPLSQMLEVSERGMGRTVVIGDIHGCYDELVALLEKIVLTENDRVVAVGDLIVKGPKNRQVLDLFRNDRRFSSVIGNHDQALIRLWRNEPSNLKQSHLRAADELKDNQKEYLAYLESLPFHIDLGNYLVVHAGLRPGLPLEQQSKEDFTELRTLGPDRTSREGTPWYEVYKGPKTVLFGHWPAAEPKIARGAVGLDTGCVYGNKLTGYIIESAEFVSVPSARVYQSPRSIKD